jgi:hypothetical protein
MWAFKAAANAGDAADGDAMHAGGIRPRNEPCTALVRE